jgi:hypothetical protein
MELPEKFVQHVLNQQTFDGVRGTQAVLERNLNVKISRLFTS